MRNLFSLRACTAGLAIAATVAPVCAQSSSPTVQQGTLREVNALAQPDSQVLLLFFVASDCPVSSRYFPEMERLAAEFKGRHVAVRYVYPNPEEMPADVVRHQHEFGAPVDAASRDPQQNLVRLTGVTTTPEAALLVRNGSGWNVVYRGRIDDRYVRFGVERNQVTQHDTESAVRAALAQQPIPKPGGPPVGCAIVPDSIVHGDTR